MKSKTESKDRFVIIMAGGRGERFWPVSREKTPKQLITLLGKRSFLQQAVDRVAPLVPMKNILVITNEVQAPQVMKQLPKLPKRTVASAERSGTVQDDIFQSGKVRGEAESGTRGGICEQRPISLECRDVCLVVCDDHAGIGKASARNGGGVPEVVQGGEHAEAWK